MLKGEASMHVEKLEREFRYCGIVLPEIDGSLDIESIRAAYSATYPEIATAAVTGPEAIGNKLVYTFSKSIGTKS
jgi:PRTRC genetic system protein C